MGPKVNFSNELETIRDLITGIKKDLESKATTSQLDELLKQIREKDKKIELLESKVAILENSIKLIEKKCDDNEQYSRRTSVRINHIPLPENGEETADQVFAKVKESGVDIPDAFLDRAHRVGKRYLGPDGVRKHQVIVKFTTWFHRSVFYRGRKNLSVAKVHIDLTQSRFKLLKRSQSKTVGSNVVDYIFADINCSL